jgi:plasmid maintenance system antidote protein VapI
MKPVCFHLSCAETLFSGTHNLVKTTQSLSKKSVPVDLLRQALLERAQKNPAFSMRAFARATGISHTVLSLVLSGKRSLSKKAAAKLADYLELNPEDRLRVMNTYSKAKPVEFSSLSLDAFSVIADWYHYAILSLLDLPKENFGAKLEARGIARRLGITVLEAKLAIERLQRLDLIYQSEDGRWTSKGRSLKVDNTISTPATRKFHKQLLEKAADSIERDDISERAISAVSLAIDASQIDFAKERIRNFRRELMAELEAKGHPDSVYFLTIQLFPVALNEERTDTEST